MGLFNLIFRLQTDNTRLNQGMSEAVGTVGRASQRMEASLLAGFSRIGAAAGAAVGIGAITSQMRRVMALGAEIADQSDALGISAERWQEIGYAVGLVGGNASDAIPVLRHLATAREAALKDPAGGEAKAFARFGMDRQTLLNLRDASDILYRFSDAVQGTNIDLNSIPEVLALIGNRGIAMVPALVAGFREIGQEARQLGIVMDDEIVKKLDDIGDRFETLGKRLTVSFGPVIYAIAEKIEMALMGIKAMVAGLGRASTQLNANLKRDPNNLTSLASWQSVMSEFNRGADDEIARAFALQIATDRRKANLPAGKAFFEAPEAKVAKAVVEKVLHARQPIQQTTRGDALLSVGNFLGSGPDAQARAEMKQQTNLLRQLNDAVRQGNRTVLHLD